MIFTGGSEGGKDTNGTSWHEQELAEQDLAEGTEKLWASCVDVEPRRGDISVERSSTSFGSAGGGVCKAGIACTTSVGDDCRGFEKK